MKGRVRLANKSDINRIVEVVNTVNKAFYRDVIPREKFKDPFITSEQLAEDFRKWLFLVCETKEGIIGTVAFEKSGSETGTVYRLYVLPEFQRLGVASALMQKVEQRARKLGLKRVRLRVHGKARWAILFYQKIGYSKVGEVVYQWGRDHIFQKNL